MENNFKKEVLKEMVKWMFSSDEINKIEEKKENHIANSMIGKKVLVRTYSAGVHFGTLKDLDNHQNCILENSRRIWNWYGAASLSQISVDGVNSESKIAMKVEEILLQRVIEIIPLSEKATKNLEGQKIWRK